MASRPMIIGGNWKMNLAKAEGQSLARDLAEKLENVNKTGLEVVLFPTYPLLDLVGPFCKGSLSLGAQNIALEESGAFTGEVSGEILKSVGCRWALVGHSERRQIFGEDDALLAGKLDRAWKSSLHPILCVGETLEQRDGGKVQEVLDRQIQGALADQNKDRASDLVLAYEPVWAIGTGRTASPEQAQEAHVWIRQSLAKVWDDSCAQGVPIMYGGSVKPDNASQILGQADVDGALVGGASLKAESFLGIIQGAP